MKKRRLDDGVVEPAPPCGVDGELPSELWANVLGYLYFDEVLTCTAVSKLFRHDVTQQMKYLLVRCGESMDVAPAVIERFGAVEKVYIYLIKEVEDRDYGYRLDSAALQCTAPFLSRLPKLQWCVLCCDENAVRNSDMIRWGFHYEHDSEESYEPNSNEKFAGLIQSVCRAYKTGKLSGNVKLHGLMNQHDDEYCVWKDMLPQISSYRDDVSCQLCDMICASFPPLHVLEFSNCCTPCIGFRNRINIVKFRDESRSEHNLTKALLSEVLEADLMPVMCPPDFETTGYYATVYYGNDIERMKLLILNGANVSDPSIRNSFLKGGETGHKSFRGRKKITTLESFKRLKDLAFDIREDDCIIIDESDERTNHMSFIYAKITREKLDADKALSGINGVK